MWLLFAVITTICWGLVLVFVKRAYSLYKPTSFVFIGAVAGVLILLPFALINHAKLILWPVLPIATLVAATYIYEFYALEKGKLALTGTVLNLYPLATLILAAILLHEPLSLLGKFGVVIILMGLVLISLEKFSELKNIKVGKWLWWGLAGAISTGTGDFLAKITIINFDTYSFSLNFIVGWLIITFFIVLFNKKILIKNLVIKKFSRDLSYLIGGATFLFIGYIFLYLALKEGLVSIVTPITASSAALTLLLAVVWLKEKSLNYNY